MEILDSINKFESRHLKIQMLKRESIIKKQVDQLIFDLKRGFILFVTLYLIAEKSRYPYEIKEDILKMTRGAFNIDRNNLYKKLRLLEKDGFLTSQLHPSSRGAERKYYTITPYGRKLFKQLCGTLIPVMSSLHERAGKIKVI
jgi:PadR family transcriptional regulator, regulatory protein PadR